jgi:sugar lactone lactonase YvrE
MQLFTTSKFRLLARMARNLLFPGILFFASCHATAQVAQRIPIRLLDGPDGMVIDREGNIFVANWGKAGKGHTIVRISSAGEETLFADSLASPDGLTFDAGGNLFVSCFGSGEIIRIGRTGTRSVFATGLDHPADLKFNNQGDLFVSSFGNFNGSVVYKITPSGKIAEFAKGFRVPLGLRFGKKGDLFVSNFGSGIIHRVSAEGGISVFASTSLGKANLIQYLDFDDAGNLYCPSYKENCIYKISPAGVIEKMTILKEGGQLDGPNSIGIFNGILYFTEFNTNSLYKVVLKPS